VDVNGLMEGKLDFNISLPDSPDINTFIEKSELMPPMLKKAWKHINGEGGMVDCLKDCATKLKELKPQVDEAVEAMKALPTDPEKIKEAAKKAVSDKKITPFDVPKIPGKMENNAKQLSRTPDILKEFMENLKTTLQDLVESLGGAAKDAGADKDTSALTSLVEATKDTMETVKEEPTAEVKDQPVELADGKETLGLAGMAQADEEQVRKESGDGKAPAAEPEQVVEVTIEGETKVCC
jgi:hypothetical protein